MAYNNPDDPYRSNLTDAKFAVRPASKASCRPIPNSPRVLPAAARSRCSRVAIAVVLGAVFYGLNNSTVNQAGTTPTTSTAQNTERTSPPAAPTGMRDVTPRTNTEPGTTTGRRLRHRRPQAPPAPTLPPNGWTATDHARRASNCTALVPS